MVLRPTSSFHIIGRRAEPDPTQALAVNDEERGIRDVIRRVAAHTIRDALRLWCRQLPRLDIADGYESTTLRARHCPTFLRLLHESPRGTDLKLSGCEKLARGDRKDYRAGSDGATGEH